MARSSKIILCDTNILIELFKNNAVIIKSLHEIGLKKIAISHVTVAELYFGAFNKHELKQIQLHLQAINIIPINSNISNIFIQLMQTYSLSHKLSVPDALIAATAIEQNISLYTLNKKDFRFINELHLWESSNP